MLTPREKAQLGIGLAQEAIVQLLTAQGNSALQTAIQDNLGIDNLGIGSNSEAGTAGIVSALLIDLADRKIITMQGQNRQTKVQLVANQSGAIGRGASSANR